MPHDMGWDGMWFGWIFWIVILVVILWAAITIIKNVQSRSQLPSNQGSISGETPLDILKKRYARGEIDKQEFEQKKKDLES